MERNIKILWARLLILILVTLVSATKVDAQQKWDGYGHDLLPLENNGKSDTNTTFYSISHPAANIVYLSSGRNFEHFSDTIPGILWKSSSNGDDWQIIYTSDSTFFSDLFFYDENHGLAVRSRLTSPNMMYKDSMMLTTDGGLSWIAVSKPMYDLQYISKDSILGKRNKALLLTTDGGLSWDTIFSGNFSSYSYVDGCIYVMRGASSPTTNELYPSIRVFKSTDFGKWWIELTHNGFPMNNAKIPYSLTDIYFYKNGHGVLTGTQHIYTKNDFRNYDRIGTLTMDDEYYSSKFLKSGYRIVACAHDWKLFFNVLDLSKDFGRHRGTYQLAIPAPYYGTMDLNSYRSFPFSACEEDTTFFVIANPEPYWSGDGRDSYLYRITPADFDSLNLVPLDVPARENIVSVTISPNPADNAFRVVTESPLKQVVVYDLLGKEVFRRSYSGETETGIAVSAWPSGTYIVKALTKEGFGEVKVVKK